MACMQVWEAANLVDWLDVHGTRRRFGLHGMVFPEPTLWFRAIALGTDIIRLYVSFTLERPSEWQMDNASAAESTHYIGEMDLKIPCVALREAAASLRAELRRLHVREAST